MKYHSIKTKYILVSLEAMVHFHTAERLIQVEDIISTEGRSSFSVCDDYF